MGVFDHAEFDNHESLHYFYDEKSGLKAIIAVHSTALGPAAGLRIEAVPPGRVEGDRVHREVAPREIGFERGAAVVGHPRAVLDRLARDLRRPFGRMGQQPRVGLHDRDRGVTLRLGHEAQLRRARPLRRALADHRPRELGLRLLPAAHV